MSEAAVKKAVLMVSHGSCSAKTLLEIEDMVRQLKQRSSIEVIEYAFLEIASPTIPEGIEHCIVQGARHIIILLNFLNAGRHVDQDIPALVQAVRKSYPEVTFSITPPLTHHPGLIDIFLQLMDV